MGSHFWHGSHTYAGMAFDNDMIAVISYLAMESITEHLPGDSLILKHMSETKRNHTSYEVVDSITNMFIDQPPSEWSMTLDSIDMPTDYMMIFTAFSTTVGAFIFPWFLINFVFGHLAPIVITNKENSDFFVNKYMPELHTSLSQIVLVEADKKAIENGLLGMLIKIIYAFLW
jgi:hypothetical protein